MSGFNIPYAGPGAGEIWSTYDGVGFAPSGKPGGGGDEVAFEPPEATHPLVARPVDKRVFLTVRLKPWQLPVAGALKLECGPLSWLQAEGQTLQALRKRIRADLRVAYGGRPLVVTWPGELK